MEIKETNINSNKSKYWMWPVNTKYNDNLIPDPDKYLLGFQFSNRFSISYSSFLFNNFLKFSKEKLRYNNK